MRYNDKNQEFYPVWFKENEKHLAEMLQEMIYDPKKTITNSLFSPDQFMRYNPKNHCFEYEDGAYLGDSILETIELLHDIKYVCDAEWVYKN